MLWGLCVDDVNAIVSIDYKLGKINNNIDKTSSSTKFRK